MHIDRTHSAGRLRRTVGPPRQPTADPGPNRSHHDRGQTTAEYALVLLAAGTIAMMVVAWANGSGAIGELFDSILSRITSLAA